MAIIHNITAEEVRGWGCPWPDKVRGEIAERLNKMPLPSDAPRDPPPPPPPPDDPSWVQRVQLRAQAAAGAKAVLDGLRAYDSDRIKEARDALDRPVPEIELPFVYAQALVDISRTIQGFPLTPSKC